MKGNILVINAGSSSVKFASFQVAPGKAPLRCLHGLIEGIGTAPHLQAWAHEDEPAESLDLPLCKDPALGHQVALQTLLSWLREHPTQGPLIAAAHRVVHGGTRFTAPTVLGPGVLEHLEALTPLAPLHQPHNLAAMRALMVLQPELAQVACFDTAFHARQAWVAQAYALPRHISLAGVKRYGFHGLSYEYIASMLPRHLGEAASGRVVVAHLGNGASLCALKDRQSVASTMGFTALEGLMMGTRCGHLDPGVVLHLMQQRGMSAQEVQDMLYKASGLLGVSGISSDMRTLEASEHPDAHAAIDLFVHHIKRELGALAAALGGLDALVFTAGIGEHSAMVRERVCQGARWLGLHLDAPANQAHATRISVDGSAVSAWVIPTNEEWMIARHAQITLNGSFSGV